MLAVHVGTGIGIEILDQRPNAGTYKVIQCYAVHVNPFFFVSIQSIHWVFPVLITIPCAVLHVEQIIFAIYYLWHCLLCAIHTHC